MNGLQMWNSICLRVAWPNSCHCIWFLWGIRLAVLCCLPIWLHVFLHVALGWNSLSSHSRFSNLRIIERSSGMAVGLPAASLGGLLCDLFDPTG